MAYDPDLYLGSGQIPPSATYDPDAYLSSSEVAKAPISQHTPVVPPSGFLNTAKGVGESALALGSGALHSMSSAVNDLLPDMPGPRGTRAETQADIAGSPILNYRGGPEAQPIMNALGVIATPISKAMKFVHSTIAQATNERTADVVGDVATLVAGRGSVGSLLKGRVAGAIEEGHPLTDVSTAERVRLQGIHDQGVSAGLDLPEGGSAERHAQAAANNQPLANVLSRDYLKLPENAPLSPALLQKARDHYMDPAYTAVRAVQEFPLSPEYETAIKDVDLSQINPKYRPPESGTMNGDQAVDSSRYLRNRASKNFTAAKGNPVLEDTAQAHWDAAQAVEDEIERHLHSQGKGQMATDWDNARIYGAQSHSIESALDGAGNVKVTNLKQQLLKGKPLSGNSEMLATLGAQYPRAFTLTQESAPAPGLIRRATAGSLPLAGAGIGAHLGGPLGAVGGKMVGQSMADRIIPP